MRVFVDASILFSAAKSDGAVRELIRWLLEHGHECHVDAYVVGEARRNLQAKGAQALPALEALLTRIRVAATVPAHDDQAWTWLPEKDRPVLAAAVRLHCEALVTGDRTLFGAGYGRTFGGVTLHSPRSLGATLWPG